MDEGVDDLHDKRDHTENQHANFLTDTLLKFVQIPE